MSSKSRRGRGISEDGLKKLHQTWLDGMGNWYNLELVKMDCRESQTEVSFDMGEKCS